MQERNSTATPGPKPGDGTQEQPKAQDANWFGPSEEPQEEFIEGSPAPIDPTAPKPKLSEGRPTFSGVSDPRDQGSDFGPLDARGDAIGARAPQIPKTGTPR